MNLSNILWTPLDLPSIPKELTLENIHDRYSYVPNIEEEKISEFAEKKQHHLYAWNVLKLRVPKDKVDEVYNSQTKNIAWEWTDEALTLCPKLIEYIVNYLPFTNLKYVSAISSRGKIPMHFDYKDNCDPEEKKFYKDNDPCYYRLLLDGEIHNNSFFVYTKKLGKKYCNMPSDSPGWIMGSYNCAHGNDEDLPTQKILLYVMGDLDVSKHKILLQRSFERFKDYAIFKYD